MSVFLSVPAAEVIAENELAFAFLDRFPVSPGHVLVVTRRVVGTFFECSAEEQAALVTLVGVVKGILDERFRPDGYNVGFNAGSAAGQTVMHVHVHVIPRYGGDVPDPRGGVRYVIPWKANYLLRDRLGEKAAPEHALVTGNTDPLLEHLKFLIERAQHIAILAAFAQRKGVELLTPHLLSAASRGATIEILTGDYAYITDPEALTQLHTLTTQTPNITARLLRVRNLPGPIKIFHAKSWRFEAPGIAWVGSSNISAAALTRSVEWNLRLEERENPLAFAKLRREFTHLWNLSHPLTPELIARYTAEVPTREPFFSDPTLDTDPPARASEPPADPYQPTPIPEPHQIQLEALSILAALRAEGSTRALVVLATGLGKTWLAAFDWLARQTELGRTPRLLFVAHRQELLTQAAEVFRRLCAADQRTPSIGRFYADFDDLSADLVFASVAKLALAKNLGRLSKNPFDYTIIDEVHHATARSYLRILDHLNTGFLLGLTATPDRADAADVAALFDDFIAFRADISRGVAIQRLVPFSYYGIKDTIDYRSIAWRNGEFDTLELESHALQERRMQAMWEAWQKHPGQRTLIFCCTVRHARAVTEWLATKNIQVRCAHSGPDSDDRTAALAALAAGTIDAICAVDLFNEGVDVPSVDRVIMLRPTGSPVVFLQQLGRGLRVAPGKTRLQVLDFVGNHRVFLGRLKTLIEAAGGDGAATIAALLTNQSVLLPAGFEIDLALEAKAAIEALAALPVASLLERSYHELRDREGERPFAMEVVARGLPLSILKTRWGGWFGFVLSKGDLSESEAEVWQSHPDWLSDLERTALTRSFKLILLEALLGLCGDAATWAQGMDIEALAVQSHARLRARPELWGDISEEARFTSLDVPADRKKWAAYWRKNPVEAWQKGPYFRIEDGRFCPTFQVKPTLFDTFKDLTLELVDARRLQYRRRKNIEQSGFTCRITRMGTHLALKLPAVLPNTVSPADGLSARISDGSMWLFRFQNDRIIAASPLGSAENRLTELLQGWLESNPTTTVNFLHLPDHWQVEPE